MLAGGKGGCLCVCLFYVCERGGKGESGKPNGRPDLVLKDAKADNVQIKRAWERKRKGAEQ